ncbi:hypothetical protein A9J40_19165 [Stenotrophomonas maltophilia]|nr:hypothetical protein A9J40_19165 [Stenotrophomonas maltophilia]
MSSGGRGLLKSVPSGDYVRVGYLPFLVIFEKHRKILLEIVIACAFRLSYSELQFRLYLRMEVLSVSPVGQVILEVISANDDG